MADPRTPVAERLEQRLRAVLRGADSRLAADVLHALAREQFLHYASEVAAAQFQHGRASVGAEAPGQEAPHA